MDEHKTCWDFCAYHVWWWVYDAIPPSLLTWARQPGQEVTGVHLAKITKVLQDQVLSSDPSPFQPSNCNPHAIRATLLYFTVLLWSFSSFSFPDTLFLFISFFPKLPQIPSNWTYTHRSVLLSKCWAQHLLGWISWTTTLLKCVKEMKIDKQMPRRP